jgi:hypothetical protein
MEMSAMARVGARRHKLEPLVAERKALNALLRQGRGYSGRKLRHYAHATPFRLRPVTSSSSFETPRAYNVVDMLMSLTHEHVWLEGAWAMASRWRSTTETQTR